LRDDIASFLVSNLPNLSILELHYGDRFFSIADAVTPELTMINLSKPSWHTGYKTPMTEVLHFLTLPTVSAFSAPALMDSSHNEDMMQLLLAPGTSKIRNLQLNMNEMSDSTFLNIMSYSSTLTKLSLLRQLIPQCISGEGHFLHCQTVMRAIRPFKDGLEVLELFKTVARPCHCGSDWLGSLRAFSRVRSLKINPELLLRGPLESVSTYNLCRLLPSTLKRLTLYADQFYRTPDYDYWTTLVIELARRILQPELEGIEIDFSFNSCRVTCTFCPWSAVLCSHCDDDYGIMCNPCYKSEYVEKLSAICRAANIELSGSWNEHVTHHPFDNHMPYFSYGSVETDV
jgi:hypothetical protein